MAGQAATCERARKVEDGYLRLARAIVLGCPTSTDDVADSLWPGLVATVERLSRCDPETDLMPKRRDDRGVRESFRMLACYVHPSVPDDRLPQAVLDLVGNPRLTLMMVVELLIGRAPEVDGWSLRRVAWALREPGASGDKVRAELGVSTSTAQMVGTWIDARSVRHQRLSTVAAEAIGEGASVREFCEQTGVGRKLGLRVMGEARAGARRRGSWKCGPAAAGVAAAALP